MDRVQINYLVTNMNENQPREAWGSCTHTPLQGFPYLLLQFPFPLPLPNIFPLENQFTLKKYCWSESWSESYSNESYINFHSVDY